MDLISINIEPPCEQLSGSPVLTSGSLDVLHDPFTPRLSYRHSSHPSSPEHRHSPHHNSKEPRRLSHPNSPERRRHLYHHSSLHSSPENASPNHTRLSYSDAAICAHPSRRNSSASPERLSYSEATIPKSHEGSPNHKLFRWKLYKLRDELEHVYSKVKHQGSKLNRRLSEFRSRTSENSNAKRHIRVEYVDSNVHGDEADDGNEEDTLELPDHNYSPSLQLMGLRDGCFAAELPLDALPTGQITIRIRNYKMEVIVGRRSSLVDDDHCISCPVRYGDIDIPIYVNPDTLNFEMDDADTRLYVTGLTKGYNGRSLSIPDNECEHVTRSNSTERLPKFSRSKSCHRSTSRSGKRSPRRSLTVAHSPSDSFRRRARTH